MDSPIETAPRRELALYAAELAEGDLSASDPESAADDFARLYSRL
jgi:hypothetical protein